MIYPEERVEKVWPVLCCWTRTYCNGRSLEENKIEIKREAGYKEYRTKFKKEHNNRVTGCMEDYMYADYSDLLKVAIVNIKKTTGEGTSKSKELTAAVKGYGELIQDELELISPRIVICGGTYEDYAKKIFKVKEESFLNCGAAYFNYKDAVFVDFPHPSAWTGKKIEYIEAALMELRRLS